MDEQKQQVEELISKVTEVGVTLSGLAETTQALLEKLTAIRDSVGKDVPVDPPKDLDQCAARIVALERAQANLVAKLNAHFIKSFGSEVL